MNDDFVYGKKIMVSVTFYLRLASDNDENENTLQRVYQIRNNPNVMIRSARPYTMRPRQHIRNPCQATNNRKL